MAACRGAAIRILKGDKAEIAFAFVAQRGDISLGNFKLARDASNFDTELINLDGDIGDEGVARDELHRRRRLRKSEITPLERTPDEHRELHPNRLLLTDLKHACPA